jgi:hypothetical protein
MEQNFVKLDRKMKRWFTLGYDGIERCLMLVSPFVLGIGGAVSSLFHLPGVIDIMLLIACFDFMFLSIRSVVHIIVSIQNKRIVRAILFALIAIPTNTFVLYTVGMGSVGEKLPLSGSQLVWFQFAMVCAALVYTIALYPWYVSGRAFQIELQAE